METNIFCTAEEAIDEIKNGKVIIVVDDEDRENEGDFVCAAEYINSRYSKFYGYTWQGECSVLH